MSDRKLSKLLQANVPMWEIDGDETISSYAEQIADINFQLKSLEVELEETNENVESLDNRINMYLGNIFGIKDFEQSKHAISIEDNSDIAVYNIADIDTESGEPITRESLPDPVLVYKSNIKQSTKIFNYLSDFNDLVDEFNIGLEDYESYIESHKELWSKAKETMKTVKYFKLYDGNKDEIEVYNEEDHVLLIAQNEKEEWGFRYIRKEDESKFNDFVSEKIEN